MKYDTNIYSKLGINGTGKLAYSELYSIIKKHAKGNRFLDYGCGTGDSTVLLSHIESSDVYGVDTSVSMLEKASNNFSNLIKYHLIESGELPFKNNIFDVVLMCLVIIEIMDDCELLKVFKDIKRVLNKEGVLIIVTTSEKFYSNKWLSADTDFPQNKNLKNNDVALAKISTGSESITFYDCFRDEHKLKQLFKKSKLKVLDKLSPLAKADDQCDWISETEIAPYEIFVLK